MLNLVDLAAYAWLIAIVGCLTLLLSRGYRIALRIRSVTPGQLGLPALVLFVLCLPLWIEAALLEVQCRSTGLTLAPPIFAAEEGLYWRSHAVEAHAYSSGIRFGTDPLRQEFALGVIRALAEGRLAYVEVPFKPVIDPDTVVNQRLFIRRRADDASQCVGEPVSSAWGRLRADLCVAWAPTAAGGSRFEVVALKGEGHSGTTVGIRDRKNGEEIARFTHARSVRSSETLLLLRGIRSVQPRSCKLEMLNITPGASILSLVFANFEGQVVARDAVDKYSKSAWTVARPP